MKQRLPLGSIGAIVTALAVWLTVGVASANAMSFYIGGTGGRLLTSNWIAASGEITPSTPTEFENFLSAHEYHPDIVYLSSPGGSVSGAMQLGKAFRKFNMTTIVGKSVKVSDEAYDEIEPSECMSACILTFAGGKTRYYRTAFGKIYPPGSTPEEEKNILGLHQFYVDDNREALDLTAQAANAFGIESAQVVMGVEMAYLVEMGVDPLLLTLASATKPRDMYTLTESEAIHFKLAMPEDLQPEWRLKFYKQALVAEGQGTFIGYDYGVSVWCPSHSEKQLRLAIKVKVWRYFRDDEIRPYQHYITAGKPDYCPPGAALLGNCKSSDREFTISIHELHQKGDTLTLTFNVDGPALAILQSGASFHVGSDAPRAVKILPWGTMRLDPRIVPTLLKTCEL
jgi:hypothetical protein